MTPAAPVLLGIEGGGTHTVALAVGGGRLMRIEEGPANIRLLSDRQLPALLRRVALRLPPPQAVGIGLAGARTPSDRERIRRAAAAVWPGVPCAAANDLETALAAGAPGRTRGRKSSDGTVARVLVLSGTGSCCYGQASDGRSAKVGGWGHVLGDVGSGYDVGLRGLRRVVFELDRHGRWGPLGERLLRRLQLNSPEDLIGWAQQASKAEIGALAIEVCAAREEGDRLAAEVLQEAARVLAADAVLCAARLAGRAAAVQFVLAGGLLVNQPGFYTAVARQIHAGRPASKVTRLKREGAWGAVELARRLLPDAGQPSRAKALKMAWDAGVPGVAPGGVSVGVPGLDSLKQSPTEQRNPRSRKLDQLSTRQAIRLMLAEESLVPSRLLPQAGAIERLLGWVVSSFRRGGRLFYVGAGTSGRLGVLDASECPPTFRTPPELVQGIIAGGQRALWEAVEGAEDDPVAGAAAIGFRGVRRGDVVVGIAASGRTPFVWGALDAARRLGARTALLCFNPSLRLPRKGRPGLVIAADVGPEVLTGSTRLKSGTATKVVLNIITTLAMVRLGKVMSNLMVDLNASNVKLRDRAVRIVQAVTGAGDPEARQALERHAWMVKPAICEFRKRQGG